MSDDNTAQTFDEAQATFQNRLKNPQLYDDILTTTTATDLHGEILKLQEDLRPLGAYCER